MKLAFIKKRFRQDACREQLSRIADKLARDPKWRP